MKLTVASGGIFALIVVTGCVSKGKYDEAVAQTETTRAEIGRKNVALEQANADLEKQRAEIAALEKQLDALTASSRAAGETREAQISDLQRRIGQLSVAHDAALARAVLFRDLAKRLQREVDSGDLSMVLRDHRMVLRLPDDVLFDTGRTELKPAGKEALTAVAAVLKTLPSRHFQVAGHTDNVPIARPPFTSNWELSSARALRVVHFLLDQGVPASTLSAAGYGEVDPVSGNDTPDGRKRNRRTEITIQPDIDEIVHVP